MLGKLEWDGRAAAPVRTAVILSVLAAIPLAAQGRRPARPQVIRPDGEVWQVIRKNCTACHGIDDYAFYALDRAGWQKLIESKHKPGEAVLSDADRGLLLDPNATPDEIEAFGLTLAALVDRVDPARSLLINKPTNRERHTGGVRIQPGSFDCSSCA